MPKLLYFPVAYAGWDDYRNYEYLCADVAEYPSLLLLGLLSLLHSPTSSTYPSPKRKIV